MCDKDGSSQPLMADVYVKVAGEGDSPEKCREARRRRIEMRRLAVSATEDRPPGDEKRRKTSDFPGGGREKRGRTSGDDGDGPIRSPAPPPPSSSSSSSGSSSSSSSGGGRREAPGIASTSGSRTAAADSPVVFGSVSLAGRAREMEDAISVRPGFFRPEGGAQLHFFAVFDGHGGSHVSSLCKDRMHVILAEELGRTWQSTAEETVPPESEDSKKLAAAKQAQEALLRSAVVRSFALMDEVAVRACACGKVGLPSCACERSGIESEIVGSTAAVALVGPDCVLVANCGDSRAVLSRAGRAVPLSYDHKPDRPDEQARIEAAGGRVVYLNGARVHGILAMSRALGDKYLKPFVISEPEFCSMERTDDDECLIIASDGLWDVLSNDLACDIARRCLAEADPTTSGKGDLDTEAALEKTAAEQAEDQASDARCSLAATLLARLALGRRSADNISVIVIDMRRN